MLDNSHLVSYLDTPVGNFIPLQIRRWRKKTHVNNRHRKTLEAIFAKPTPSSIEWQDIETLLIALGCEIREGKGSRVRFKLGEMSVYIHRPHPKPVTNRHTVRAVRDFLERVGIEP